jgi:hypothetical protein
MRRCICVAPRTLRRVRACLPLDMHGLQFRTDIRYNGISVALNGTAVNLTPEVFIPYIFIVIIIQ